MKTPSWLQLVLQRLGLTATAQEEPDLPLSLPSQHQLLLDQIFAFNTHLLRVLKMLEPHRHDSSAAAEIRRLSGYRYVLIEFAVMAATTEEAFAEDSVFQRAERWIDDVLLEARRNNVDADTFEGYMQLKRNLERRVVEPPGLRRS
jgi:hypothetical protein